MTILNPNIYIVYLLLAYCCIFINYEIIKPYKEIKNETTIEIE